MARSGDAAMWGCRLCRRHAGGYHWPDGDDEAAGRRCSGTNRRGERCRHWTTADSERQLCWPHAYPEKQAQVRHGCYQRRPAMDEAEQALMARYLAEGEVVEAVILLSQIQIRGLLRYLKDDTRPVGQCLNGYTLVIRECNRIAKLRMGQAQMRRAERRKRGRNWKLPG